MKRKLSGVYTQKALDKRVPLLRSFDDYFKCPHSRYTEVRGGGYFKTSGTADPRKSDEAGVFLVMNQNGSQIFVQGHPEYDRMTLNNEYHRDLNKGLNPALRFTTTSMMTRSRSPLYVEKYGEHAVYELAELLRISGDSAYAGGRHRVNRDSFWCKKIFARNGEGTE